MDYPKILFQASLNTPFIKDDLETLKKSFIVKNINGSGFFYFIKIAISCLSTDIAFSWFASTYSFLTVLLMKLLGKKSIIVIGGADVAKDIKIGYGIWLSPWKSRLVKYALRHANKIIAVESSLAEKAKQLAQYDGGNIEIVPTGYDEKFWNISVEEKSKCILTVASINDNKRFLVKGIDVLIAAARLLTQVEFIIIGLNSKIIKDLELPQNIQVLPSLERTLLLHYYQKAKIYCQPSRHEGMPNVLCEAMLCGCIPVATDVGATKSIVGESGIVIPSDDSDALISAIQVTIQMPEKNKYEVRKMIANRFSVEKRRTALIRIIEETT